MRKGNFVGIGVESMVDITPRSVDFGDFGHQFVQSTLQFDIPRSGHTMLRRAIQAHEQLMCEFGAIFRGLTPFIAIDLLRLALLVIFPSISLALRDLVYAK